MVAKLRWTAYNTKSRLNLAKIHIVAKPMEVFKLFGSSLNLAKIHMVAKPMEVFKLFGSSLNLAKIHMVAKLSS